MKPGTVTHTIAALLSTITSMFGQSATVQSAPTKVKLSKKSDRLSEDLRVRCLEAIEHYQAEHGTAPNALVIETTGNILASYQTG